MSHSENIPHLDDEDLIDIEQGRSSNRADFSQEDAEALTPEVATIIANKQYERLYEPKILNRIVALRLANPAAYMGKVITPLPARVASNLKAAVKALQKEKETAAREVQLCRDGNRGRLLKWNGDALALVSQSECASFLGEVSQDKLAYAANGDLFYTYENGLWVLCDGDHSGEHDARIIAYIDEGVTDASGLMVGYNLSFADGAIKLAKRGGRFRKPKMAKEVIAFRNGLLCLNTGGLIEPSPDYATTWRLGCEYHPEARCDFTREWLAQVTGDEGAAPVFLAAVNKGLKGRTDIHKFIELLGPGGAGKSTLIRLLTGVFGGANTHTTEMATLEDNQFERVNLVDKRFLTIPDVERYAGKVSTLKSLSGGDHVRLERKHIQATASYLFEGLIVVAANNHQFKSEDYSSGLARRKIVLPFMQRWSSDEQGEFKRRGGEEGLLREVPGIIVAALALTDDEVSTILNNPPEFAVDATIDDLASTNNIVAWIEDNLVFDPAATTQVGGIENVGYGCRLHSDERLFPNYRAWADFNNEPGARLVALRNFTKNLCEMANASLGFREVEQVKPGNKSSIKGVRIRKADEKAFDWRQRLRK